MRIAQLPRVNFYEQIEQTLFYLFNKEQIGAQ